MNSTCAWVGDDGTIWSIDTTSALLYCLRNASLVKPASARSERRSFTASYKPHRVCRATVSSSPLDNASR